MDEAPDYPPDPTRNALMIVIAELFAAGYFDEHNLDNIAEKLELCEHGDLADRVRMLPVSVMVAACSGGNEGGLEA